MIQVEFGSLFQFIRNGMNVKQDKSGDGLPITRIETISSAKVNGQRVGYAGLFDEDCNTWLLKRGDILFSHINSVEHIGKCAVYEGTPEKLVHGMNLLCLRCDQSKLLPEFAKYLIRSTSFRSRLANFINKAVNQASVSIGNLRAIPVSVPSISEQRRLATILDQADTLRVKRRETLIQLDELQQAIFVETFGHPAAGHSKWPVSLLGAACEKISDGTHHSPPIQEYGIPYITAKHLKTSGLDFYSDPWFVSEEDHKQIFARCDPRPDDILYIKDGATTGIAAVNRYDFPFSMLSSLALLRPNKEMLNSLYLCHWLNHPIVKTEILGAMAGAAIRRLTLAKIKAIEIPLPPLSLQNEFSKKIGYIRTLKETVAASLSEFDYLFSSLQERAFQGKL